MQRLLTLQRGWHQVLVRIYCGIVAKCKWEVVRGVMYRPPQVDDLEALAEEGGDLGGGEMLVHVRESGGRRLVSVSCIRRLSANGRVALTRGGAPANS